MITAFVQDIDVMVTNKVTIQPLHSRPGLYAVALKKLTAIVLLAVGVWSTHATAQEELVSFYNDTIEFIEGANGSYDLLINKQFAGNSTAQNGQVVYQLTQADLRQRLLTNDGLSSSQAAASFFTIFFPRDLEGLFTVAFSGSNIQLIFTQELVENGLSGIALMQSVTPNGGHRDYLLVCSGTCKLLESNVWNMLVFPMHSSVRTVRELLADDLPSETYGVEWAVFRYVLSTGRYLPVQLDDAVILGQGYWMIQLFPEQEPEDRPPVKVIDVPIDLTDQVPTIYSGCPSATGCFALPLNTTSGAINWTMLGSPFVATTPVSNFRVSTSSPSDPCTLQSCTITESAAQNLTDTILYTYDPDIPGYVPHVEGDSIGPWEGFWFGTAGTNQAGSSMTFNAPKPGIIFGELP
jgi:hypothetical protein